VSTPIDVFLKPATTSRQSRPDGANGNTEGGGCLLVAQAFPSDQYEHALLSFWELLNRSQNVPHPVRIIFPPHDIIGLLEGVVGRRKSTQRRLIPT
jgi:hypothetical protein